MVVGLALIFRDGPPLDKIPPGRLPGDIPIRKSGFTLFPWVTGLVIRLILFLLKK